LLGVGAAKYSPKFAQCGSSGGEAVANRRGAGCDRQPGELIGHRLRRSGNNHGSRADHRAETELRQAAMDAETDMLRAMLRRGEITITRFISCSTS